MGLGAAMIQRSPWRYSIFSPLCEISKPRTPPMATSDLRDFRSCRCTVRLNSTPGANAGASTAYSTPGFPTCSDIYRRGGRGSARIRWSMLSKSIFTLIVCGFGGAAGFDSSFLSSGFWLLSSPFGLPVSGCLASGFFSSPFSSSLSGASGDGSSFESTSR